IEGAQAGLHMSDRYVLVERGEGASETRGGITLHDDAVGLLAHDGVMETFERGPSHMGKILVALHDVQGDVWLNARRLHHLVEHLAVLPGDDDEGREAIAASLRLEDHRRELDSLRACANHDHKGVPRSRIKAHE